MASAPAGEPRSSGVAIEGLDAPICLTWELTYACNLACVHCLSSSGRRDPRELTTSQGMALLEPGFVRADGRPRRVGRQHRHAEAGADEWTLDAAELAAPGHHRRQRGRAIRHPVSDVMQALALVHRRFGVVGGDARAARIDSAPRSAKPSTMSRPARVGAAVENLVAARRP